MHVYMYGQFVKKLVAYQHETRIAKSPVYIGNTHASYFEWFGFKNLGPTKNIISVIWILGFFLSIFFLCVVVLLPLSL